MSERPATDAVASHARLLLLGPLDLRLAERSLSLSGRKPRAVLAMLALARGDCVSTSALIDGVWGQDPPPSVANALQVAVSSLRKSLADAGIGGSLVTQAPGYRLLLPPGALDVESFESERRRAVRAVAENRRGDAAIAFEAALSHWRGAPLADLAQEPFAGPAIAQLEEARLGTVIAYLGNEIARGRGAGVVGQIEATVRQNLLVEELWALLAQAYYQSSRQAEALSTLRRARRVLDDELGVEPGPLLRDLEQRILSQDPALDPPVRGVAILSGPSLVTHLRSELAAVSATLVMSDGARLPLQGAVITIGRRPDNDVVIDNEDVSRGHAEIRRTGAGHIVQDLGSTNGTAVNGELVRRIALTHGDRIELGPVTLRYEVDEASESAT